MAFWSAASHCGHSLTPFNLQFQKRKRIKHDSLEHLGFTHQISHAACPSLSAVTIPTGGREGGGHREDGLTRVLRSPWGQTRSLRCPRPPAQGCQRDPAPGRPPLRGFPSSPRQGGTGKRQEGSLVPEILTWKGLQLADLTLGCS